MAQLKTFYIQRLREWRMSWYDQAPTEFKAIEIKDEDGNKRLHLLDRGDTKETFVRGKGWVRLGKRKIHTVPAWDGETDTLKAYLDQHGAEALFRSMTLEDLNTSDCVAYNAQKEFYSLLRYSLNNLERWNKFHTLYEKFLAIERKVVYDTFASECRARLHLEHHSLRPVFSVFSIPMEPSVTVLNAQKNLTVLAIAVLERQEDDGKADPALHDKNREEIWRWFDNHNVPDMVERYYGKEAADLYNELEDMYHHPDEDNTQKPDKK